MIFGANPQISMLTVDPEINLAVAHLFNEAQVHTASHRKNIQALRRLHQACSVSLAREQQFFLALITPLNVILAAGNRKAGESVSRSLRFLLGFLLYSAEHDADETVMGGSSPIVRLIENLMLYAAEGLDARDRLVRARLAQVMVACVNAVDELSEPVWEVFRVKMTERLFDREAVVRVHAVHAMARLQVKSVCVI